MSKERKIYMNGRFIEESEAKISIFDSALMFGDMVFEMTRSFNKKHFKLKEHLDRLYTGLKILRYDLSISKEELYDICIETAKINEPAFKKDDEHRLMIDISRGVLGIYEDIKGIHTGPNIIVADFPLKWTVKGMSKLYKNGINNVVTSQRVIPSHLMDPKIKNRSRLFYLMANIEASLFKGDNNWALMLDPDGFIAEGSGDNFFIIKNGELISPEGRNMLRGITREYIMKELAPQLDMPVKEKNIELFDAYEADEAFICATPFCMIPVTSINSVQIGDGKPGKYYKSLIKKWSTNVGLDIINQVEKWDNDTKEVSTKNKISPYKFK
tara:strand:- start:1336 stop:2316 length:981 start_codon:yes stop_codon:yes gene_type:complete